MDFWKTARVISGYNLFGTTLLKITLAVLTFLLFLFLRKLFARLFISLFNRLGRKIRSYIGIQIIAILEPPVRLLIVVVGVWIASLILGLSGNTKKLFDLALHSAAAFLLFWTAFRSTGIIALFIQKFIIKSGSGADSSIFKLVNNGLRVVIVVLCAAVILKDWGYDIAALLTGLGLGGLAFALAAKDTLSNLFGGIVIMIDRPFVIGDWILTSHGEGVVEEIGFRSTRIRTFEQALITIPNSLMSSESITNWSRTGRRRINMSLTLGNEILDRARECMELLRRKLSGHPEILPETVSVHLDTFDDKKLHINISLFTKAVESQRFLEIREEINFNIITVLQETEVLKTGL